MVRFLGALYRFLIEPGAVWLWIRVAVLALGGLPGVLIGASSEPAPEGYNFMAGLLMLIFTPVVVLLLVGLQAINPFSARIWRRPSWYTNPLLFTEPLQFFHLAAFYFLASGAGVLLGLPLGSLSGFPVAVVLLSIGLCVGVRLCISIFTWKMADEG